MLFLSSQLSDNSSNNNKTLHCVGVQHWTTAVLYKKGKKKVAHFSLSIQSAEERRSQIFVMAVKIKIIHIRISKIHKMSCIWNIQNTYQNSSEGKILRRLKRCEILLHKARVRGTCTVYRVMDVVGMRLPDMKKDWNEKQKMDSKP